MKEAGWPLRGVAYAGLAALALTGPPGIALALVGAAGLAWRGPRFTSTGWLVAHGAVLGGTGLAALVVTPSVAFSGLVTWLLAHRAWMGRTGDDARVALLLATLLLLLGAAGTESPLLAGPFLAFGLLLPAALLRAELGTADGPLPRSLEVALALVAGVLAVGLFFALPRLDAGYLARQDGGGSRFPADVTLGEEGLVNDDSAEVMRVRVTDREGRVLPGPFHLRGRGLDRFDGSRWVVDTPMEAIRSDTPWDVRAEVELDALSADVLFGPRDVLRVDGTTARRQPGSAFVPLHRLGTVDYAAYGRTVPLGRVDATDVEPWLQLPETLDGRITSLAWTVVPADETDPVVVAQGLSDWLGATYRYEETPPPPVGDPVAWFLFEHEEGHCEYFASALTVLLRARGIPARLATGFYAEEQGDEGWIVVRRGNAHAWVEVRTDGGWATLDPTPASSLPSLAGGGLRARFQALVSAWYREIVEYDMNAQFAGYGVVGKRLLVSTGRSNPSPFGAGLLGMLAVVGGMTLSLGLARLGLARLGAPAARRVDEGAKLAANARAIVRRRGWALPDDLPLLDAADWLEARVGPPAGALRRLADLVYAARYADRPLPRGEARACLDALRRIPRARG